MNVEQMIFVFGSNLSGIHGAGAARFAREKRGAVHGVGEGLTGQSYALPTKGKRITFLSLEEIQKHVDNFLEYARNQPDTEFQVTQLGCGLAGFSREEIVPMFEYATENCYFDRMWKNYLPSAAKFWGSL